MSNILVRRRQFESIPVRPDALSGIAIWYDASDLSAVTKDGSNKVSQLSDKSGRGAHAVQATGSLQPTWISDGINGLPAVVGDGYDDFMAFSMPDTGLTHSFYVVAAFDTTIGLMPQYSGFITGANVSTHQVKMTDTSANPAVGMSVPFLTDYVLHPANTSFNIKSGIPAVYSLCRDAGSFWSRWTWGEVVRNVATSGLHLTQGTTTNKLFHGWTGVPASFRISELVCYSRNLNSYEESRLSAYFKSRYGVWI